MTKPSPNTTTTMKSEHYPIAAHHFSTKIAITLLFTAWTSCFMQAQQREEKRAVMFERTDYVSLEGKTIPELHKRSKISDSQNRSIEGEWVSIDRKNKKVKFRRTDGKEFEIGMDNLSSRDRRYAELETGNLWEIDNLSEFGIIREQIIGFESMDDKHVRLYMKNVNDPSAPLNKFFPIDQLTEKDRALIKEKTGRDLVVPDKPAVQYSPSLVFGRPVPKYERQYFVATMSLINLTFTPKEMADSVITRTMTSAFIHQYYNSSYEEADEREKIYGKPLADVLKIIGEEPSPLTEQQSIKPLIAKHKLALYEEKVPRDPAEPERVTKDGRTVYSQPGVPIDGELQALHFMAQLVRVSVGKPKVALATLLENTNQGITVMKRKKGAGAKAALAPEQRRKFYYTPDVLEGIEKSHGFKAWRIFVLDRDRHHHRQEGAVRTFFEQLTHELIRKNIRDGKPVYVRKMNDKTEPKTHGTQLVITGFKAEAGKPVIYEAISIKGSIHDNDPYTGEYEVTETTLPETELDCLSAVFLDTL
jgi:hypothetical protein